ncbi:cell division protein FtsL [Macrococcus bovicus]|uniref:Cell division protein FtsL n=1 Tax=Macrococcus bovicus TaxID=69968 RepID=A0A4R6C1H5_9STAP|nr:cell division protein FtsL [Macrococcus bovicus]TDM15018.1 cell division protein FtsL [Macrococcus bovicus]WJP98580.1 cell division protein FtsL [Macrococcus bovicus]
MAAEYVNRNVFDQAYDTPVKTKTKTATKTHVVSLSKLEKMVYLVLVALIALVSSYMLSLKYDAYDMNSKIATTQSEIIHQKDINGELKSEAMKQSSYERIYSKAQGYGLSLKNDNVKVVQKDGSN